MTNSHPSPNSRPKDPDRRFVTRGGQFVNYYRPWDYLSTAILMLGLSIGVAIAIVCGMVTNSNFRHPAVLVLWAMPLGFGAIGGWALRRFIRWRRARIAWARFTRTPYRGIFTTAPLLRRR